MKPDVFEAPDYYNLDDLLSEEHKLVREAARYWVKRDISPIIETYAQKAEFPKKPDVMVENYLDRDISKISKELILKINPKASIINNYHPIYELPYIDNSSNNYKADLNIKTKKTILFFGLIREYKGLDLLINAIGLSKNKIKDLNVLVVGENYESLEKYHKMIRAHNMEDSFTFINSFVDKGDIKKYFLSSELVVLPYKSASQSGVLSLAYNFNRPVITTDVGGLSDYVSDKKSGFIVDPNSEDISKKINMFFDENLFEFHELSRYL